MNWIKEADYIYFESE